MDRELLRLMRKHIKSGDVDAVKKMVSENDGILDEVTPLGSWLHVAAGSGNCDLVNYFIDEGMDVNLSGGLANTNPIGEAADNGHVDVIKILYQHGAKFDVSEATKNPLFGAIHGDHFEVVQFLVENGIDITLKYKIGKLEQCDAYEYARQFGRTRIAHYLKEKTEAAK